MNLLKKPLDTDPCVSFMPFGTPATLKLARAALAPSFCDRTLAKGRPQGIEGPLFASRIFRQAFTDLRCEVEQLIVAGDRIVAHLHFLGHFSGVMGQKKGVGNRLISSPLTFCASKVG